jgi:glycosyltransferase involved in cell wall biosynthesis
MRDLLPPGRLGDLVVRAPGDRYLGLAGKLRDVDIVHTQELGYWYSMQAARLKPRLGFRLVMTVWETIPFLGAYRNARTRGYRAQTLEQTDLFLAATERARTALLLEGAADERICVCPPGVARSAFAKRDATRSEPHVVILSPGRLVWEKGHQDVLRAVALLRKEGRSRASREARVCVVGTGPEERRLRTYARELGIADAVEFGGFIPHERMPGAYAAATCVVLASLPTWSWEEQFGMVLAEAMAAGVPIVASSSGAIPEVAGERARYFSPGDWVALADELDELLANGERDRRDPERLDRYSVEAAAVRLTAAYDGVLTELGASSDRAAVSHFDINRS